MRKNLFILGGIAAGLVLACVVGWIIYAPIGGYQSESADRGSRVDEAWSSKALGDVEEMASEVPPMAPSADASYGESGLAHAAERLITADVIENRLKEEG